MTIEASTELSPEEMAEAARLSEEAQLTAEAYGLSAEKFNSMKAADRETILFMLLREMAGSIRSLEMRIDDYEAKFKELGTPEGMQELTQKFMGGMGGGGMFGGLFK